MSVRQNPGNRAMPDTSRDHINLPRSRHYLSRSRRRHIARSQRPQNTAEMPATRTRSRAGSLRSAVSQILLGLSLVLAACGPAAATVRYAAFQADDTLASIGESVDVGRGLLQAPSDVILALLPFRRGPVSICPGARGYAICVACPAIGQGTLLRQEAAR